MARDREVDSYNEGEIDPRSLWGDPRKYRGPSQGFGWDGPQFETQAPHFDGCRCGDCPDFRGPWWDAETQTWIYDPARAGLSDREPGADVAKGRV